MSSFRKEFTLYNLEELKGNDFCFTPKDSFIPEGEVNRILDSIENGVNIIKDKLEEIKGLSEIDDIYNIAKVLSDNLY